MTTSMAASHAAGKKLVDVIFGASAACNDAVKVYGADKVTNATIGVLMDNDEKFAVLPTVERIYRELTGEQYMRYAAISGTPAYLDKVLQSVFADHRPEGYTGAIATSGGTGALHHAIANYVEKGSYVLTSDWFWGTYNVICHENGCKLTTYKLFDENNDFNFKAYSDKVAEILAQQDSLLSIINSPAHNPTGFSLSSEDWDNVLALTKKYAAQGKKMTILVDIAYIDFAGEKNEARAFMDKFSHLPDNVLVLFAYSMSKAYTAYGMRTGALVALSDSKAVIEEFQNVNKYTSRATWSNINRGAQELLVRLANDRAAQAQFEKERDALYQMVRRRGNIFMQEAQECGLPALPYKGGFFLAVPAKDSQAVCNELHKDLIFAVPLKAGVRVAACSVSEQKMHGVAAKIKKALAAVEN